MPEYLAPGVYVEEVDTGSKPIEGVSTSTTGMVGVTERGPVNVPILVTSYGEYTRWFGERLNHNEFSFGNRSHCYLPHAVDGFFTNGGKRLYIVRVLDATGATHSYFVFHGRGTNQSASTVLLRNAAELTGTAATTPIYVLNVNAVVPNTDNLAVGDRIRIGAGSVAEYCTVDAVGQAADANHVPLSFPLNRTHSEGVTVDHIVRTPIALPVGPLSLAEEVASGSQSILVTGDAADVAILVMDQLLEIGNQFSSEHRFVTNITALDATHVRVVLETPLLMSYESGAAVTPIDHAVGAVAGGDDVLGTVARAGDRVAFVVNRNGAFTDRAGIVVFNIGDTTTRETRRIGDLYLLSISTGAYGEYPASSLVEVVTLGDDDREMTVFTSATEISVDDASLFSVGDTLRVGQGPTLEEVVIETVDTGTGVITLRPPGLVLPGHAPPEPVVPGFSLKELNVNARAGTTVLALDNRVSLSEGDVIRIGTAPNDEYATIASIPSPAAGGAAPNAGNVVLAHPLNRDHTAATEVRRQNTPMINSARPRTVIALDVTNQGMLIVVSDGDSYAQDEYVRISTTSGQISYHRIVEAPVDLDPRPVTLTEALTGAHQAGAPVVERTPLFSIHALDAGAWGNRLRVSVMDEPTGLVSRTSLSNIIDPTHIRLSSAAGVESGTVIELLDTLNNDAVVGDPLKVVSVDRASEYSITLLGTGLSAVQQAAEAAAVNAATHLGVRSREFRLTVSLLRQPDPAMPSRNEMIIDTEIFRHLSMDQRHSRYIQNVIGDVNGELRLSDRRPEGESWYVRVHDLAQDLAEPGRTNTLESIRLGPEVLIDILPDGRQRSARHSLSGGDDSITTLTDDTYIGSDAEDPEERTGLQSLRNKEEISLVACPGQTSPAIQGALINHCQQMRFRFAVLDSVRPPNDTINDVQMQRQQFDTKYAALYYPWILIPNPFPTNLTQIEDYPIPASGHALGIYARTDIERGVHKAPANEVVRGILGLQRTLNKGEHDILNPYPVNINVIRDFRLNNRGIRVWGGRVITSDPDWKYVNVRRLLIFIEYSIERGLQWVVFEPNAEPLWARVRRSISNFLTVVWRNGALEGTDPEEAFFVKCDRTTMTQTDIDNGRLICVIGVAPVKPAEFVIIRIGLWTAHAEE
jgi:phage tail sheath protein FI